MSNLDWGAVPAWISAVSAVSALITALGALVYARRTWNKAAEEARRKQAELVAAWVQDGSGADFRCCVRNASDLPIYDVDVVINGYGEIVVKCLAEWSASVVAPKADGPRWTILRDEAERTRGPNVVEGEIDTRGVLAHDLLAEIRFTDAAGRRWRRDDSGLLGEFGPG
ncbi:hypothetical protein [Nocardia nova]|uniref:hypothetical protein n=1 Tax=Nocardia nova TaxID=37330 RepID=UPI0033ED7E73